MVTNQEKAERFAKSAPAINQQELEKINELFPAYLFRRSKTKQVWTSCCGRYTTLSPQAEPGDAEWKAMTAPHQREPQNSWTARPEPSVLCPFCGRPLIVKELGRTGKRDNLCSWRRAVVLRWYRGALWATAYDCKKAYGSESALTKEPECHLLAVYRFRPGLAEAANRNFYNYPFTGISRQDVPLIGGRWRIGNPFPCNEDYGITYSVIGLEQIQKSPFRYCMAEEAERRFAHFMQYLTACCFYPRQIEMLMKAGMTDVVQDLVARGVKHAAVIDWESTNTKNVFGLSKQELKTFLRTDRNIQTLELYKKLKGRVRIEECEEWAGKDLDLRESEKAAKAWSLPLDKLLRYLNGQVGCGRYGGLPSSREALRIWRDYVAAAQEVGYPLHRENVLLPKNLGIAHDSATDKQTYRMMQEREKEQREKARLALLAYQERKKELENKYGYEADGYLILVPEGREEIVEEGHKLQHCVAGYADRHMEGKVVILFMRKAKEPAKPWLTIEMNGNQLVQIHGFKNEGLYSGKGRFADDPRELYRDFLDTWLDWIKKGSKRNKDGTPRLPRTKKGAAA